MPAGTVLLVVEADRDAAAGLSECLVPEGFEVRVAADGVVGLAEFQSRPPDLVLIDLALPGIDGLDLCRRIRAVADVPIIMMSAKGSEVDAVLALEMGADDYVSRSCRMHELVARVRAALRRAPVAGRDLARGMLRVGSVTLDRVRCEVTVGGERVNLPRKEYRLLEALMEHPGRVLSRKVLIARVWGDDYVGTTKTLDVHIRRLRGRIEEDAAVPRQIVTVRGLGFKFEPPQGASVTPIHLDTGLLDGLPIADAIPRATVPEGDAAQGLLSSSSR